MLALIKIILLLSLGLAALWWLSGYDPGVAGEDKRRDYLRRAARCLVTLLLASVLFLPNAVHVGYAFIPLLLIVPPSIGVLWAGCIGTLCARGVHHMIDSDEKRTFDPDESVHNLDIVAGLLRNGRHEEAVKLCEQLKKSGGASVLALEAMLARAGIQQEDSRKPAPLAQAARLRAAGNFGDADAILESLLEENPANADAALMRMRLYAQNLHRADLAGEVLQSLEQQPHVPAATLEFARRSLVEWSQPKAGPAVESLPESIDELLAGGYFGTAIEALEKKTAAQPEDFASWLKLAEAHGLHSGNLFRAEKIVSQIGSNAAFTPEQIQLARARLDEWRAARPRRG